MLTTALALLVLQAAPYRVGPELQAAPAYQTGPTSTGGYVIAAPSAPELARTGVTIDAYDRRIEARWGADDPFYTATVRGGAAAAQSRQGSLDGGWTVSGVDGAPLYALQLADTGEAAIDGAWRAIGLPGGGSHAPSGFIALVARESGRVILRFSEPGSTAPTVVSAAMTADGSWRGELSRDGATPVPVVLRKR